MANIEAKLERVAELVKQRDAINAELATIFGVASTRKPGKNKCSHCGGEGHNASTCPNKPADQQ